MKPTYFQSLLGIIFWGILSVGFLLPILIVALNVLFGSQESFIGWSYYWSGFLRSFLLAVISLLMCWLVALPLISAFPFWSQNIKTVVFLFFAVQMLIGLIPRLYGYLGAFSSSGFIGLIGRGMWGTDFESPLAYSLFGTSLATNIIYSPFFFLPLISRLFRVPTETVWAVLDLGGKKRHLISTVIRNEVRWSIVRFSSIYFLIVFSDFACSDLVGGGKVDAFGKTIYRTLISFQDYWGASVIALGLGIVVFIAAYIGSRGERV